MSEQSLPEDVQDLVTRLFAMARNGDAVLVDYVRQGVDPNLKNQDGNTFVMLAAYSGHAGLVRELAEVGADVNLLNERGQSPLAGAIFKKEDEVVHALLAAGADPLAGQPTAVDCARMFGRADLLDLLQ
ncbi:ankyrin repeat domain-containing protein [Corynebacterium uterequi]|uniref:Ankyrin repeats (3 copies) n=1 Tax=Corynebacterium uterequi TaxID=1072256 RepID=A0A0G3HE81_9CORY|nr:ankyrin repeat domain-containing protein [Corynebacterium uterequi]AKK11616.1 Ankyrin repeats (3 copies) [Corynebacterium uterequi]